MGIQKVHPIVAVTGALVEDKEDVARIGASTQIQNQEQATSSGVQLCQIEECLDKLICAYSKLSNNYDGTEDVNQGLEGIVKVMDLCSKVDQKIAEDVAAYASLLTSVVVKNSCTLASPTTLAASSKALASAASHQVGCCIKLTLDYGFSSHVSSLTLDDLVQQSHQFLESLNNCLTVTVCHPRKSSSLRRTFENVIKRKISKKSCGIEELKRAGALIKKIHIEEKEDRKMALASHLKKACQDLENGIADLQRKISLLRSYLVNTRVALLDFLTYSS